MGKTATRSSAKPVAAEPRTARAAPAPDASPPDAALSDDDKSKDAFFVQVAEVAEAMIAKHGKDFAIGTLVLSAKFIAESRPLINPATDAPT